MWIRKIDVAAPNPLLIALAGADQAGWLGIVDDDDIFVEGHAQPVLLIVGVKNLKHVFRQVVLAAVQGVVKTLGDLKEIIAAGDDLPLGFYLHLIHQGDKPVEDLSHPSTYRS